MYIMPIYKCRYCEEVYSGEKIFKEKGETIDGFDLSISIAHNKVDVRDTSTMYREDALKAPLIAIHHCGEGVNIGVADLIGLERVNEDGSAYRD